jgi:hypothetical protein
MNDMHLPGFTAERALPNGHTPFPLLSLPTIVSRSNLLLLMCFGLGRSDA